MIYGTSVFGFAYAVTGKSRAPMKFIAKVQFIGLRDICSAGRINKSPHPVGGDAGERYSLLQALYQKMA